MDVEPRRLGIDKDVKLEGCGSAIPGSPLKEKLCLKSAQSCQRLMEKVM